MARRVEDLEFKVAHLERALQDLSDVLYRQQQRLDAQQARVARLSERLDESSGGTPGDPRDEKPPHY
ncbi:MAG: SlyX family protein [Proteobacteria bacterium]|nr:SlyX family protein [Pseudomonadota bacterium]